MKLILLGDSHTRGYTNSAFVEKLFFLGPGKTFNFTTTLNTLRYLARYIYIASKKELRSYSVSIVIGEPDVRFATYQNYYISEDPARLVDPKVVEPKMVDSRIKKLLEDSIARIKFFLYILEKIGMSPILVIGANSPNYEMKLICQEFNQALSHIVRSRHIYFYDPTAEYYSNFNENKSWIGAAYNNPRLTDATHFSKEVGAYLDEFILSTPRHSIYRYDSCRQTIAKMLLQWSLRQFFFVEYSDKFKVYRVADSFRTPLSRFRLLIKRAKLRWLD